MSPSSFLHSIAGLGTGYALAIALCSLVLLSSLLLASYICCRSCHPNPNPINPIVLPRVAFVAADDNDVESGGAVGLDSTAIGSYPKFRYSTPAKGEEEESTCSICLCEYGEGEVLRMMPDCRHYFHLMCIGVWLRLNASCPVCLTSPMPMPLSTPLPELVSLSQYSDDRTRRR